MASVTNNHLSIISAGTLALVSTVVLGWYMGFDPSADFQILVPGSDNEPQGGAVAREERVVIGEHFEYFDSSTVEPSGNWPRFRGVDFSNISKQPLSMSDKLGSAPNILWSHELGEGHAGPAVYDGRVYLLDYDEDRRTDALRCFALADGRELWRRSYTVKVKRNHGMSRTVPAVSQDFVVTIGPRCHVMCVERETGEFLWGLDLERDHAVEVPLWYTGQCPLIDGSTAVIATGGTSLMIGVDCASGEILWETPNPDEWKMSHSSIMLMEIEGKRQYVYCANGGVVGVSAELEDQGTTLWKTDLWSHQVVAPAPLDLGSGRIFVSAGYSAGGMLLQVSQGSDSFSVDSLQSVLPHTGMASEQQTAIYHNGQIYGILPKDGGSLNGQFACFSADDISELIWSSGKTNRFGLGPYILADNKFFILDDEGELTVIDASAKEFSPLVRVKILEGPDAWGPLAIVDGKLIARDARRIVCVEIRGSEETI